MIKIKIRLVILGVLLIVLFGAIKAYDAYRNSFQTITIASTSGFKLTLYEANLASDVNESNSYDKNKMLFSTQRPGTFEVKRGDYVYVVTSTDISYQTISQRVRVGSDPVYLAIPALSYTDSKLTSLLASEEPSIKAAIQAKYPSQMQLYSVQSGKLYKDGSWYGAKLIPNDLNTYDTLRIVLKKEGSAWKIITDPPDIVISQPVYPDIPSDVLTDLDNFR